MDFEEWWAELEEDMEAEENAWDEDMAMIEDMAFNGPFAVQNLLQQSTNCSHGGSRPGKRRNINRRRQKGAQDLWNDYFSESPIYYNLKFRRRYRMSSRLFNKILCDICAHDRYFQLKVDACGQPRLLPHQKMTTALRQLAYGVGADATDEYCRLAESTSLATLYRFVKCIRDLYEKHYLRKPTAEDFAEKLRINKERGFPGMFGSLDCCQWVWKNCPIAWQGQYTDKDRKKSIILEVVADQELWIWHAFFGLAGGNNDINVLDRSPLLNEWIKNDSANVSFHINSVEYNRAYLLTDAIYPKWSMFISTVHQPQTDKLKHFTKCQEAARKDVERAFGVLQARFEIIKRPARSWYEKHIINILYGCVILHNMIIEDERDDSTQAYLRVPTAGVQRGPMPWIQFLQATTEINNEVNHFRLRNDIVEHLWNMKGLSVSGN